MMDKKAEAEFYIKCNKLFITELKRIKTRFEKNRVKELQDLIKLDEEMEQTSEQEILDAYGYGCYDQAEYDRRIAAYRKYQEEKEKLQDMPTVQTQLIKIINGCIGDTEKENEMIRRSAMTDEEKAEYYKKQAELEIRRKKRLERIN